MSEYPCRTKEISGVSYHITIHRDGKLVGTCSGMELETTEKLAAKFRDTNPNDKVEVHTSHWTKTVCIECGNESY